MSEYFREIVRQLDELPADDANYSHQEAEKLLLAYLKNANHGGAEVVRAYLRAKERVGFWYA